MTLCVVVLPDQRISETDKVLGTEIQERLMEINDIKLIYLDQNYLKESVLSDNNINSFLSKKISLNELDSDYILFLESSTKIGEDFFEKISFATKSEERVDFYNLITVEKDEYINNHDDIKEATYDDITSLKVIKRNILDDISFFNIDKLDRFMLTRLNFELFARNYTFNSINNVKYTKYNNRSIDDIILESKILEYIISHENDSEKFVMTFKKPLIENIFKIVDNRNFVDLIPYTHQKVMLDTYKEIFLLVNDKDIERWNLGGYLPFIEMVREELYTEALYYMRLLRGKRHWYNTTHNLQRKIKSYPIESSLSWRLTSSLRKISIFCKKLKNNFQKWGIQLLSIPIRLMTMGRDVWLVSERPDQAEDNGYFFFKYCREKFPNKKVYYILDKNSPHVEKVRKLGNVIYHSSLKHWIYMLVAKKYISAWVFEEFSYPKSKFDYKKTFKKMLSRKHHITLQHGVIIHNIAPYLNKQQYNQKLIVASSYAEKEVIKNTLNYEDKDVAVTGLSRFDNLHDLKIKKQILIMPTWRRSLFRLNKSEFLLSEYFNRYFNLVRNKDFINLVEQNNIIVKFYVHHQMQQFINEFALQHPNIKFLSKQDAVVSELLKESALLITDYSSVMADFLYMEKPILLYQFDPYNNHHGPVKEISYSDFGEIISEENVLVDRVKDAINRNFKIEEKYKKKSNAFFAFKDKSNSERIYNVIKNIK